MLVRQTVETAMPHDTPKLSASGHDLTPPDAATMARHGRRIGRRQVVAGGGKLGGIVRHGGLHGLTDEHPRPPSVRAGA